MLTFLCAGYLFVEHLLSFEQIEFFKLLNLIGLVFDGIGILLLSNLFMRHAEVKKFVQGNLYTYAFGFLTFFPMGIFSAVGEGFKNQAVKANYAAPLLGLCGLIFALSLLFEFYIAKKHWKGKSVRFRASLLGTFFLMNGLFFQFVAAYLDLRS